MNTTLKHVVFWLAIVLSGVLLYSVIESEKPKAKEVSYSQFLAEVSAGRVKDVAITGSTVMGSYKDGSTPFRATLPSSGSDAFYRALHDKGVAVTVKEVRGPGYGWLFQLLPIAIAGFWILAILYLIYHIGYLRGFRDKSLT